MVILNKFGSKDTVSITCHVFGSTKVQKGVWILAKFVLDDERLYDVLRQTVRSGLDLKPD